MIVKTYGEILKKLIDYTVANQDSVTDFNKGGVLLTQYEAFARILERFYVDVRNGFANNLRAMAYSIFDFKPKKGTKATVGVQFSRSKVRESTVTIPSGVKISSNGLIFETSETAIINPDEKNSNIVSAQAVDIGLKYNVEPNAVNVIESLVPTEVVSVTNPKKAVGGSDNETDSDVLERFKEFINGLQGTNTYGIKSAVLGVEGVRSLSLEEHFPPVEDIYNVTVYVDDGSGSLTPTLKNTIMDIINGTDVESNPGKRAAGINVRVLPAIPVPINVNVNVKVYRTSEPTAKFDIQNALENAIGNLKVDDDVIYTSLIIKLRRIAYVKDIVELTVNEGNENIPIDKNQVAKLGTVNITVTNI